MLCIYMFVWASLSLLSLQLAGEKATARAPPGLCLANCQRADCDKTEEPTGKAFCCCSKCGAKYCCRDCQVRLPLLPPPSLMYQWRCLEPAPPPPSPHTPPEARPLPQGFVCRGGRRRSVVVLLACTHTHVWHCLSVFYWYPRRWYISAFDKQYYCCRMSLDHQTRLMHPPKEWAGLGHSLDRGLASTDHSTIHCEQTKIANENQYHQQQQDL